MLDSSSPKSESEATLEECGVNNFSRPRRSPNPKKGRYKQGKGKRRRQQHHGTQWRSYKVKYRINVRASNRRKGRCHTTGLDDEEDDGEQTTRAEIEANLTASIEDELIGSVIEYEIDGNIFH